MNFYPELMKFADGREIKTAADWQERRKELVEILGREEYGYWPEKPAKVTGTVYKKTGKCCSGHATLEFINIYFETPKGMFSFPVKLILPNGDGKKPLFVFSNFRNDTYDMYCPTEEVVDNGFGIAIIYYNDITSDDNDLTNGIASLYDRDPETGWGKISMWAYCASCALDYLSIRPEIDMDNIAAIGHSRLGKTTLWFAANDERVKYACVNGSGCAGAAYERTKHEGGETVEDITRVFPYWFCGNYKKYCGKADEMPFDQHFAVAACAPRYVIVGDATKDAWADQYSSQLSLVAASPAWKFLGKEGYIGKEEPAVEGDRFADGDLAYHLRNGVHFLGRGDWLSYINFIKSKM